MINNNLHSVFYKPFYLFLFLATIDKTKQKDQGKIIKSFFIFPPFSSMRKSIKSVIILTRLNNTCQLECWSFQLTSFHLKSPPLLYPTGLTASLALMVL